LGAGPESKHPPLIINLHGYRQAPPQAGACSRARCFSLQVCRLASTWDYAASTGYGLPYRDKLNGRWGLADFQDTIDAAAVCGGIPTLREPGCDLFVTAVAPGRYTVLMAIAGCPMFPRGQEEKDRKKPPPPPPPPPAAPPPPPKTPPAIY